MRHNKQWQINDLSAQLDVQKKYADDLRIRHDRAIAALAELSAGYGRTVPGLEWHHSMMKLAKDELVVIAKMSLRVPV